MVAFPLLLVLAVWHGVGERTEVEACLLLPCPAIASTKSWFAVLYQATPAFGNYCLALYMSTLTVTE